MAKCFYCEETATLNCGLCFVPICDEHKHAVNRWHNAFHASWICEGCYQLKERKRKIVLVPIAVIFAFFIAKSMDVQWGFTEPSMWGYFFALATVVVAVMGAGAAYQLIMRPAKKRIQGYKLLAAVLVWAVLFLLYRTLS